MSAAVEPYARPNLKPLTSLRFGAALLVFLYHAPIGQPFAHDHSLGQAGVGFFFLLSGFILTYTYRGRLNDARSYALARFSRIYPTYVVATAIALVVLALFGGETWSASDARTRVIAIIAQLVAVQAWIPDQNVYLGVNSPAWSISVEAFFYTVFPLLLTSMSRSLGSAGARVVFVAGLFTWACVTAMFLVPHTSVVWSTYIFPPVRLIDFVAGMLLAFAFLNGFLLRGSPTMWEFGALVAVGAAIIVVPRVPVSLEYSLWMLPFWAALIAVSAHGRGLVSRLLSAPLPVRLGEVSFAFYLVHSSAIILAQRIAPAGLVSAFAFTVALAGAFALNIWVERPMRTFIRKDRCAPTAPRSLSGVVGPT